MALIAGLMRTRAPAAVILVRLLAGSVFFAEGLKKLLFAAKWGAGRAGGRWTRRSGAVET